MSARVRMRIETKILGTKQLTKALLVMFAVLCTALSARAEQLPYMMDFGVQAGVGYYIGDAEPHPFACPRYAYGAQLRYKFDQRWAIQLKGQYQQIALRNDYSADPDVSLAMNDMVNLDVVGEFNFLRYGQKSQDSRVKPITPYIFLGLGMALYNRDDKPYRNFAVYFPFGIGMKWRFATRWQLLLSYQHNLYFADDLENVTFIDPLTQEKTTPYSNTYNMNGSNILNNDLTGQLTLGIAFEFAKQKGSCKTCSWKY